MKKILFLIIFVIFSKPVVANYSYFHFDPKKMTLSDHSFRNYVIPQLRSISNEYFYLIKKMDPLHSHLVQIKNEIEEVYYLWTDWLKICKSVSLSCNEKLSVLHDKIAKLDNHTTKSSRTHFALTKFSPAKIELGISINAFLSNFSNRLYKILHEVENVKIKSLRQNIPYPAELYKVSNQLHDLLIQAEINMTVLAPKRFRSEFDFLWANYIQKVDRFTLIPRDKEYFMKNLESLNIAWNTFHMNMIKSNLGFPRDLSKTIIIMHRRWNSILKIILRR